MRVLLINIVSITAFRKTPIAEKIQKVPIAEKIQKVPIAEKLSERTKMEALGDEKYKCYSCTKIYDGYPSAQCNCYEYEFERPEESQRTEEESGAEESQRTEEESGAEESQRTEEESQRTEEESQRTEEESQHTEEESGADVSAVSMLGDEAATDKIMKVIFSYIASSKGYNITKTNITKTIATQTDGVHGDHGSKKRKIYHLL
jgi:cobalamin biosynthesis protein CobT